MLTLGFEHCKDVRFQFGIGGTNSQLVHRYRLSCNSVGWLGNQVAVNPGTRYYLRLRICFTTNIVTGTRYINVTHSSNRYRSGCIAATNRHCYQQAVLFGSPGGASFQPSWSRAVSSHRQLSYGARGTRTTASLNPTVQGLISQQRARILSEPTDRDDIRRTGSQC